MSNNPLVWSVPPASVGPKNGVNTTTLANNAGFINLDQLTQYPVYHWGWLNQRFVTNNAHQINNHLSDPLTKYTASLFAKGYVDSVTVNDQNLVVDKGLLTVNDVLNRSWVQ